MGWEALIPLIVTYGPQGVALAEKLWKLWTSKAPPTQADFDSLRALANQSAADRLKVQLAAAGIALDSPQAVALLAQVS